MLFQPVHHLPGWLSVRVLLSHATARQGVTCWSRSSNTHCSAVHGLVILQKHQKMPTNVVWHNYWSAGCFRCTAWLTPTASILC